MTNIARGVIDMGTERMEKLLEKLDFPQRKIDAEIVHVTGTNGKGSVVEMVATSLSNLGKTVGTFTSPFLVFETDSIRTFVPSLESGVFATIHQIPESTLNKIRDEILSFFPDNALFPDEQPTDFEVLFACCVVFFARFRKVDILIVEVGMGGRDDATNLFHHRPTICILTGVALDHEKFLGDTLEKICENKCGIVHANCRVVFGDLSPALRDLASRICIKNGAISIENPSHEFVEMMEPPLNGAHQKYLTAIASTVVSLITGAVNKTIARSIANTKLPGRLERRSDEKVAFPVILDGAHNVESAIALRRFLDDEIRNSKVRKELLWIMSTSEGREKILPHLLRAGETCVCIRFESQQRVEWIKCANPNHISAIAKSLGCEAHVIEGCVEEGLEFVRTSFPNVEGKMVVVAGSLYLVRNYLRYV